MERGQEEQHGVRVHRDDEQREDGQCEQGAHLACEHLGVGDGPPREQAVASDEPANGEEGSVDGQADGRPLRPRRELRRERPVGTRLPDSQKGKEHEEERGIEPEREPAAIAAKSGRKRYVASPKPGEEIDDHRQAGQHGGEEDEDDRPAADDSLAEVDVARGPFHELDRVVQ